MAAWTKVILAGDAVTDLKGTAYRLLLVDSTGAVSELAHGTSGYVLKSGGAAADPSWAAESAGAHALDAGQTDVVITTPADNEVLAYDNGTTNWINQTPAEAGLEPTLTTGSISSSTFFATGVVDNAAMADDAIKAAEIDATATDIAFAQIILTPVTAGTGTTEGTLMYDSDDNHLYVYVV